VIAGDVSVFAGSTEGFLNGPGNLAQFNSPVGVALNEENGCMYVADKLNNSIRKISMDGMCSDTQARRWGGW
jgi:hypothetical protein